MDEERAKRRYGEKSTLPIAAFARFDETPDASFYGQARLVTHIDGRAIARVTELYRELLPAGARVLDLMSSWVSHLPPEIRYGDVVGLGMNATELSANPRLSSWIVQDLNCDPVLPFADGAFDAVLICVSVQYLRDPVTVLTDVRRVLGPTGVLVITFSNRCFPTKAVAIWTRLHPDQQAELVRYYLTEAGLGSVKSRELLRSPGDPLWAVVGRVGEEEGLGPLPA